MTQDGTCRIACGRAGVEKLSDPHRKEFVDGIIGAKKPGTRERRIQKSMEMLVAGARLKG
jgi:uncharacterized protein YdeI (YjbR/CyaY-like superfamily)